MIKVFTVSQMVAAEKASDAAGNSYEEMMEKAGAAVAQAIIDRYPVKDRKVTILVGPGNNGGDGLVAGRYLAEAGAVNQTERRRRFGEAPLMGVA